MTDTTTTAASTLPTASAASLLRAMGEELIKEATRATDRLKAHLDGQAYDLIADAMGAALRTRHMASPWIAVLTDNSTDDGVIAATYAMYRKALAHLMTGTVDITQTGALQGVERAAIVEGHRRFVCTVKPILDQLAL